MSEAIIAMNGKKDTWAGFSPCVFCWALRAQRPSVCHCLAGAVMCQLAQPDAAEQHEPGKAENEDYDVVAHSRIRQRRRGTWEALLLRRELPTDGPLWKVRGMHVDIEPSRIVLDPREDIGITRRTAFRDAAGIWRTQRYNDRTIDAFCTFVDMRGGGWQRDVGNPDRETHIIRRLE